MNTCHVCTNVAIHADAALCLFCSTRADRREVIYDPDKGWVEPKSSPKAEKIVRETLLGALPPEAQPSFMSIAHARYEGRDKIVATLTMFDAMPAVVHLNRWAFGWSHGWDWLPGGDISWEGDRWVRYPDSTT